MPRCFDDPAAQLAPVSGCFDGAAAAVTMFHIFRRHSKQNPRALVPVYVKAAAELFFLSLAALALRHGRNRPFTASVHV